MCGDAPDPVDITQVTFCSIGPGCRRSSGPALMWKYDPCAGGRCGTVFGDGPGRAYTLHYTGRASTQNKKQSQMYGT